MEYQSFRKIYPASWSAYWASESKGLSSFSWHLAKVRPVLSISKLKMMKSSLNQRAAWTDRPCHRIGGRDLQLPCSSACCWLGGWSGCCWRREAEIPPFPLYPLSSWLWPWTQLEWRREVFQAPPNLHLRAQAFLPLLVTLPEDCQDMLQQGFCLMWTKIENF